MALSTQISDIRKHQERLDADHEARTAANEAGILRLAREARAEGASVRTVGEMLGFASYQKTKRYLSGLPVRGTGPSYKRSPNKQAEEVDDWELPF